MTPCLRVTAQRAVVLLRRAVPSQPRRMTALTVRTVGRAPPSSLLAHPHYVARTRLTAKGLPPCIATATIAAFTLRNPRAKHVPHDNAQTLRASRLQGLLVFERDGASAVMTCAYSGQTHASHAHCSGCSP